jgi:hypothetical protein
MVVRVEKGLRNSIGARGARGAREGGALAFAGEAGMVVGEVDM